MPKMSSDSDTNGDQYFCKMFFFFLFKSILEYPVRHEVCVVFTVAASPLQNRRVPELWSFILGTHRFPSVSGAGIFFFAPRLLSVGPTKKLTTIRYGRSGAVCSQSILPIQRVSYRVCNAFYAHYIRAQGFSPCVYPRMTFFCLIFFLNLLTKNHNYILRGQN